MKTDLFAKNCLDRIYRINAIKPESCNSCASGQRRRWCQRHRHVRLRRDNSPQGTKGTKSASKKVKGKKKKKSESRSQQREEVTSVKSERGEG